MKKNDKQWVKSKSYFHDPAQSDPKNRSLLPGVVVCLDVTPRFKRFKSAFDILHEGHEEVQKAKNVQTETLPKGVTPGGETEPISENEPEEDTVYEEPSGQMPVEERGKPGRKRGRSASK